MIHPATDRFFSTEEISQLQNHGVSLAAASEQIALLRNPPPPIVLNRACTVGDGISLIAEDEQNSLIELADRAAASGRLTKFVPASGAATRMFKDLISTLNDTRRPSTYPGPSEFFERLDEFPFGDEVRRRCSIVGSPQSAEEERAVLRTLLEQMGYAVKPKGLIPFHKTDKVRTAFEEQLLEGAGYTRSSDGTCRIHFTIAPAFRDEFQTTLSENSPEIERRKPGVSLRVTFSEQDRSTDTLAIDADGNPFRNADGALLFRPGGHGALLHNLQQLGGDLVVVKNIDNILPDEASRESVRWKRLLIGYLARIQGEVFGLLASCSRDDVTQTTLDRALAYCASRFARLPEVELEDIGSSREFVVDALDRPIRVCGVVRNAGEPGGAPFWVRDAKGGTFPQIVEASQVNMADSNQVRVFNSSTHFNPVDLVCGLRSWKDEPFNLESFVDPATVFLSKKSYEGLELTALELPGLWNGAMARWNTVFVEVPAATFAPVKTVFDLLRPEHQIGFEQGR